MLHNRALCAVACGLTLLCYAGSSFAQAVSQPLRLTDALAQAEDSSPDVRAAAAGVEAAVARARQAGYRPNPEAHLTVEDIAGSGPYTGFDSAETTLSIAQQFEFGGKRSARVRAAAAEIEVANLELAVARADLRRDVRTSFAEIVANQRRVTLAQDAVTRGEEIARLARLLVEGGREPPLRQLRAETALSEAKAALAEASANELTARLSLAERFGSPEPIAAVLGDANAPAEPSIQAVAERLDVQLAVARSAAARAVVDRERALGVPDVTAEAGVRHHADTGDGALIAGVSIPLPIRDRNQGATAAAEAEARAADIRREQALAAAARADREASATLAAADAQVSALSTSTIPGAKEALRLARLGYEAGKFGLIDVLDAQAALRDAETRLVDAQLARDRAFAALERARTTGARP